MIEQQASIIKNFKETIRGLDAWVWCNCVETGRLSTPHPFPDLLRLQEDGAPCIQSDNEAKIKAHDEWMWEAHCPHADCILLQHRIGNGSTVGFICRAVRKLSAQPEIEYPILSLQVLYSGTHCGDWLEMDDVKALKVELAHLKARDWTALDLESTQYLTRFVEQMDELIAASLPINKPIVF